MAAPSEISVIIPAFNEAPAIAGLVADLSRQGAWYEILVIDDGSTDGTAEAARRAGARVVRHPYNKGNGAAVKTGVRAATGEYVLLLDGDAQHDPADSLRLAEQLGEFDLVVGARAGRTQATGPRRLGNALLNVLASYLTGRQIPDLTSGFRAANRRRLCEFIHLLPNGFSYPTTSTLAFIKAGYNVEFVSISARPRAGRSKIRFVRDGTKFTLIALKIITLYSPLRIFLPISATAFLIGTAYAVWTIISQRHVTNSSVLLVVLAVMVFLIGLVSEQISALRFERRE